MLKDRTVRRAADRPDKQLRHICCGSKTTTAEKGFLLSLPCLAHRPLPCQAPSARRRTVASITSFRAPEPARRRTRRRISPSGALTRTMRTLTRLMTVLSTLSTSESSTTSLLALRPMRLHPQVWRMVSMLTFARWLSSPSQRRSWVAAGVLARRTSSTAILRPTNAVLCYVPYCHTQLLVFLIRVVEQRDVPLRLLCSSSRA
jgi:hypothetical protein